MVTTHTYHHCSQPSHSSPKFTNCFVSKNMINPAYRSMKTNRPSGHFYSCFLANAKVAKWRLCGHCLNEQYLKSSEFFKQTYDKISSEGQIPRNKGSQLTLFSIVTPDSDSAILWACSIVHSCSTAGSQFLGVWYSQTFPVLSKPVASFQVTARTLCLRLMQ